jgi:hypothetical protein
MAQNPKLEIASTSEDTATAAPSVLTDANIHTQSDLAEQMLNPFSPENLKLSQAFTELMPVQKLLTTVPVRKPQPQDWVRTHPSPEFRQNVAVIDLRDEREVYVVSAPLVPELIAECVSVTLHLTINRQGTTSLWPIRLPDATGKDLAWWQSARDAADRATRDWIRIRADMSLGAYQIWQAAAELGEPEWPELGFWQIVQIAFKNNLIDTLDHDVVKRFRGQK